jgi:hypothetical protein
MTVEQRSMFDEEPRERGDKLMSVGVPGSASMLTKAQKQFNKWVARIAGQKQELAQWQAFVPVYQQHCISRIEPLTARLREVRVALVLLLDKVMDGKALGKQQRVKVKSILLADLRELLDAPHDAELVRLHDKYSDECYEDLQQNEVDSMRDMASEVFGVDIAPDIEGGTPEELARLLAEKMRAVEDEQAPPLRKPRKTSAKAAAQEALREQAAQGASKAMREVYRKLASELHPDREPDLEQRARKTALMTQVNQAYEQGDLLALLELQLSIEQIDTAALAGMAQERLLHYNRVLEEQSLRLSEELLQITMPFVMTMGDRLTRRFTPQQVQRGLDADVHELQTMLHELETDLASYQDVRKLKDDLRHYRIAPSPDDDEAMLFAMMSDALRAHTR